MRKSRENRDVLKEFLERVVSTRALSLANHAAYGLPARARPGLSEKTRTGKARRLTPICAQN